LLANGSTVVPREDDLHVSRAWIGVCENSCQMGDRHAFHSLYSPHHAQMEGLKRHFTHSSYSPLLPTVFHSFRKPGGHSITPRRRQLHREAPLRCFRKRRRDLRKSTIWRFAGIKPVAQTATNFLKLINLVRARDGFS
jgi:hypothetical protein